jgi:hypothetical protein
VTAPKLQAYVHTRCGASTSASLALAELEFCNPKYAEGIYCGECLMRFPESEFKWEKKDGSD